jgi:Ca2+/H+ antiporter
MNFPQQQRIGLAVLAAAVVVFLIPALIPALRTGPWVWISLGLQIIVTVAMLVYLVRFVRHQRDDYWRERGKDPRHPEL